MLLKDYYPRVSGEEKLKRLKHELFDRVTYRIFATEKETDHPLNLFIDLYPTEKNTIAAHLYDLPGGKGNVDLDAGEISEKEYCPDETHFNAYEHLKKFLSFGSFCDILSDWVYCLHDYKILSKYRRVRVKLLYTNTREFVYKNFWLIDLGIPEHYIFYNPSCGQLIPVFKKFPEHDEKEIKQALEFAQQAYLDLAATREKRVDHDVIFLHEKLPRLEFVYEEANYIPPVKGLNRPEYVYHVPNQ